MLSTRTWPFPAITMRPRFDTGAEDANSVLRAVQKLLESKGGAEAASALNSDLLRDNFQQREEIRALKKQMQERVPDGAVVLTAADAAVLKQYQELGKPEDLTARLAKGDQAVTGLAKRDHQDAARKAATAAGLLPEPLLKLPGVSALKFEVKKESVDGEDRDVAYVTDTTQQGAAAVKLLDYAKEAWPEFLPALEAEAAPRSGTEAESSYPRQRPAAPAKSAKKTEEDFRKATESTASYQL